MEYEMAKIMKEKKKLSNRTRILRTLLFKDFLQYLGFDNRHCLFHDAFSEHYYPSIQITNTLSPLLAS